MAVMASLDIVLNEHKLSGAQKNAVIELLSGGFTTAKPNTVKSLVTKGLVVGGDGEYTFEPEFREKLRDGYSQVEYREKTEQIEAIQNELNTNMWDDPEVTTEEVAQFTDMFNRVKDSDGEIKNPEWVDRYQDDWAAWEKELGGFEETLKWSNTSMWDGLTAQEIREDMDTAMPINRKARRLHTRTLRNAARRRHNAKSWVSRKSVKICGGKG
jgi:hypothetical protein